MADDVLLRMLAQGTLRVTIFILGILILRWALWSRLSPRSRSLLWFIAAPVLLLPGTLPFRLPDSAAFVGGFVPGEIGTSDDGGRFFTGGENPETFSPEADPSPGTDFDSEKRSAVETASAPAPPLPSADPDASPSVETPPVKKGAIETPPVHPVFGHPAPLILGIWGIGFCVMILYWLKNFRGVRRRIHLATSVEEEPIRTVYDEACRRFALRRAPLLLWAADIRSPALTGWRHPRLLIPCSWDGAFSPERFFHVFLHELAHHRRGDIPIGHLTFLFLAVHWFNPLVWVAARLFHADQEEDSDARAISLLSGDGFADYAETLYEVIRRQSAASSLYAVSLPGAVGMISDARQIQRRIKTMTRLGTWKQRWFFVGLAAALAVGGLAQVRFTGEIKAAAEKEETSAVTSETVPPRENGNVETETPAEEGDELRLLTRDEAKAFLRSRADYPDVHLLLPSEAEWNEDEGAPVWRGLLFRDLWREEEIETSDYDLSGARVKEMKMKNIPVARVVVKFEIDARTTSNRAIHLFSWTKETTDILKYGETESPKDLSEILRQLGFLEPGRTVTDSEQLTSDITAYYEDEAGHPNPILATQMKPFLRRCSLDKYPAEINLPGYENTLFLLYSSGESRFLGVIHQQYFGVDNLVNLSWLTRESYKSNASNGWQVAFEVPEGMSGFVGKEAIRHKVAEELSVIPNGKNGKLLSIWIETKAIRDNVVKPFYRATVWFPASNFRKDSAVTFDFDPWTGELIPTPANEK